MKTLFGIALLVALPALAAEDPILWPEAQRAFFQDGPGLLLTPEQREELLSLDEAGRDAFIERFLADPVPETEVNELRQGIELRRRLAFAQLSPIDARGQLLFLQGPPAEKRVIDCGNAFKPLEIWIYGAVPNQRRLVLYQSAPEEPFRLWLPMDSKRALYTEQMGNWLDQWETLGIGGKRIDRFFCPESVLVDEATGIDGLRGQVLASAGGVNRRSDGKIQEQPYAAFRWARPQDRARFLARPDDLVAWARAAAATRLAPPPPRLALESLDLDFPDKQGQRLVTRILVALAPPGQEGGVAVSAEDGKDRVKLMVEGTIEREGQAFEEFRMRFRLPPPERDGLVALLLERRLRPGQPFLLRLKVRDEASGAEARVARGFLVPEKPEARLARASTLSAAQGEMIPLTLAGKDSLILVPPIDEVVLGTWRAEAMVNGERIVKVVFLVDGEPQLSRTKPPYSAEVRLAPVPREQVVKVEGYDEAGELVTSDEVVINQTRGAFRVMITEPAEGARTGRNVRRVRVRAEVAVPDENRVELVEIRVNDRTVTTLSAPPWQAEVDMPDEPIVHLTVVAQLDDGRRTESVRFLRAPENLEHVDVNLVELFATVTDGGGLVRGLTAGDFEVLESGKPQTVSRFELVENLPLTLGFVIDTSTSMASSLVEAQRAADGFLRKLKPKDRAFAVGFATRPYLAMPPTDDLEAVSQSLEGMRSAGATALYDGLITALYYFRGFRGQRALILLSDGEDTASNTPWARALEYAQRSGVAIYAIGLNVPALSFEVRGHLSNLSETTGGKAYYVERAEELAEVYGEIERELRSRYYLAYESERAADEYGYRPVEVRVKRGGKVRTARGYYP